MICERCCEQRPIGEFRRSQNSKQPRWCKACREGIVWCVMCLRWKLPADFVGHIKSNGGRPPAPDQMERITKRGHGCCLECRRAYERARASKYRRPPKACATVSINCAVCGETFQVPSRNRNARYCSRKCAKRAEHMARKGRGLKPTGANVPEWYYWRSQTEVARILGVSKQAVQHAEMRAIRKLKELFPSFTRELLENLTE